MGFERNSILKALALADGCPDRAVDLLLNGAIGGNDAEQPLSDFLSPRRKAPDGHYQRATECGAVPPSQRRRQKHSFRGAADDHLQATPAQMAARAAIARQAASAEPGSVSTTETSQDAATASDILAEQRELLSPGKSIRARKSGLEVNLQPSPSSLQAP